MSATHLLGGLADPVDSAQTMFRALLEAMAGPGTVVPVGGPPECPKNLSGAAAAVLLTLTDYGTPVWYDPRLGGSEIAAYVAFHTGAPVTTDPGAAVFALIARDAADIAPDIFNAGTPEYPDRSTTLIVEVDGFDAPATVRLTGPGIEYAQSFSAAPLPDIFWPALVANAARFPLGVDVVLTSPEAIAAIPRSTRIEV